MLILPLLVLIPVNILLIVTSVLNLRADRQALLTSSQNYIDLTVSQLARDLSEVDGQVVALATEDSSFLRLGDYPDSTLKDPDFYMDLMRVFDRMNGILSGSSPVEAIYLKLDTADSIWGRGDNISRYLEGLELTELTDPSAGVSLIEKILDNPKQPGILRFYRISGVWVGYFVSFRECIAQLQSDQVTPAEIRIGTVGDTVEANPRNIALISLLGQSDLSFSCIYPPSAFQSRISAGIYVLLVLSILSVVAAPILVGYYYRQIYRPVSDLRTAIRRVSDGELDYRVPVDPNVRSNEFAELSSYFNGMMDEVRETKLDVYEMQIQKQELQLSYYSQQIRPHFILNCLNLIYTTGGKKWDYAKEMILNLTSYFRYIVNIRRNEIGLGEEMEFLKTYLRIEKQRLGDFFYSVVSWDHEQDQAPIPPLSLSTFVENSIRHALSPEDRCFLAVDAAVQEGRLRIRISDSGAGFPEEVLRALETYLESGAVTDKLGTGIINSIERFRILYPEEAVITFRNDGGAVTEISIPAWQGK